MSENETNRSFVIGQKYAFATVSLVLGIFCFINLLGLEKPILAILFGWLALRSSPEPRLDVNRISAKAGIAMGCVVLIIVPAIILMNLDRLREIIDVLSKLGGGR